jgi:hypothetical protein
MAIPREQRGCYDRRGSSSRWKRDGRWTSRGLLGADLTGFSKAGERPGQGNRPDLGGQRGSRKPVRSEEGGNSWKGLAGLVWRSRRNKQGVGIGGGLGADLTGFSRAGERPGLGGQGGSWKPVRSEDWWNSRKGLAGLVWRSRRTRQGNVGTRPDDQLPVCAGAMLPKRLGPQGLALRSMRTHQGTCSRGVPSPSQSISRSAS